MPKPGLRDGHVHIERTHRTLLQRIMNVLALDIGGANLKAADGLGYAAATFFPLWKQPNDLPTALRALIASAPPADHLAVTMTGELADCYRTKREGVGEILAAVATAAEGRTVLVYGVDGNFRSTNSAVLHPLMVAASNWHALAKFAVRFASHDAVLLIDIGSTTSDIIPLQAGAVAAQGTTDPERLALGELVYTGVERSPLCAIVGGLRWQKRWCPVAQELFATARDAYLMLGDLPEDADDLNTADGRPATRENSWDRLARSICADREMFSADDALAAAHAVRTAQCRCLEAAAAKVTARFGFPSTIILSGHGEFLGRQLVERLPIAFEVISLNDVLGPAISRAAPAHALAVLARESIGQRP